MNFIGKNHDQPVACDHCKTPLGIVKGGRLKIYVRSRCLVIRPDAGVEIRCHHCKKSTDLPLKLAKSLTSNLSGTRVASKA